MDRIILLVYIFIQGVQCAQWSNTSPPDGQIIYSCLNDGVTLSWECELAVGDRVQGVTWFYTGSSKEIMAVLVHGRFIPMANFSNRVSLVGNAGISLSKVQVADSGNYSVEVQVLDNGSTSASTLLRTVTLIVSDGLMTTDSVLHAVQDEEAVVDPSTGQWSIQLSCGAFLHQDTPPFSVQWLRGATVVNSTSYSHHHFHLILKNPVQGETYTCRIPPQNAADVCLQGKSSQAKAAVTVNQNDARHSLVIKELQVLRHQDQFQKDQIQSLKEATQAKAEVIISQNDAKHSLLLQELQMLKEELQMLKQQDQIQKDQIQSLKENLQLEKRKTNKLSAVVYKMENESKLPVAFHAIRLVYGSPSVNTPFIFGNILFNYGGGYNRATGHFTAPEAGIYFVAASTGSFNNFYAYLMTNNNVVLATIYGHNGNQHAAAHAVVHLHRGHQVWLKAGSANFDVGNGSAFSGFLLSRDN